MSIQNDSTYITPEQYLEMERKATYKSEYYQGEIFAMAGAKIRHNAIKDNMVALMMTHLRKKSCRTFSSDQRVLTATDDGLYSYPDIIVICGSPRFTDMVKDTVTNPSVIVEILSKSTEAYDRGEKFRLYRRLPTFIEYVLIDATKIRAEVYRKNEEGIWSLMADADKLEHDIYLNTIDLRLSLNDIYEGWSELPEDE